MIIVSGYLVHGIRITYTSGSYTNSSVVLNLLILNDYMYTTLFSRVKLLYVGLLHKRTLLKIFVQIFYS